MEEVHWIYLVDYTGTPVEIFFNKKKEIAKPNYAVISNFLFGIREINKNLEDNKINKIEINQNYFFYIEEKSKELFFVIKSEKMTFIEKILDLLFKIKERFMKVFHMNEILAHEKKLELLDEFRNEVKELMNIKNSIKK
ncbi:MAG: hypothetical protein KGD63_00015 [Candidatus Lokiarchaeota archaeon]|nr:hypothetical protein [Candidatus Lokiarchaeota archaeon]